MLPADALIRRTGATPLTRRSLFAGAGATATVLALAACDDTPSGTQAHPVDGPAATLSKYGKSSGDAPVWQVPFDLDEDEDAPETYSGSTQATRLAALETKRSEQEWTASDPLLVLDPYGTTRTGLYVHFADASAGALEFTITADATAEYHRTAANHTADGTGFTGLLVGLIPGAGNRRALDPDRRRAGHPRDPHPAPGSQQRLPDAAVDRRAGAGCAERGTVRDHGRLQRRQHHLPVRQRGGGPRAAAVDRPPHPQPPGGGGPTGGGHRVAAGQRDRPLRSRRPDHRYR